MGFFWEGGEWVGGAYTQMYSNNACMTPRGSCLQLPIGYNTLPRVACLLWNWNLV